VSPKNFCSENLWSGHSSSRLDERAVTTLE
jgi:hypothetical protein